MVQGLTFPPYDFQIDRYSDNELIWDDLRKKWFVLTPEEWVRQHLVEFLYRERAFPKGLMMLEHRLKINQMDRRADLVVYNSEGKPVFMAECKRPKIKLDQHTLDQIARYNLILGVPYLLITNGLQHYCLKLHKSGTVEWLKDIPNFTEL